MSDESLLEVAGLDAGYGDLRILREVSLSLARGERVLVFGPNGSGKSTLLKAISGIVRPSGGTVRLGDRDLAGRPAHSIVRAGVSYVPQTENVFADLTVEENLEVGAATARRRYRERRDAVMELFPRIAQRRRQLAGTLSGGERQLVAIGRALMLDPDVLLLDEPGAALSTAMADQVFQHVLTVNRERGVAVLLVEQNVLKGLEVAERGYLLENGAVRLAGTVAELRGSPAVRGAYLGAAPGDPPGRR